MATFFLDLEGGNDANDGTTFANRWKTVTSGATAARTAPGDTIKIMGSPAPSSLGINATWTNKSSTLTLASALNSLITDCETAWTASANVTCTADTTYFRTGTKSAAEDIAGAFGTGLVAYFDLGSNQNYSAYQGITLWVMVRSAALAASTLSIRLCSDAAGVTTVDTLALPAIAIVDSWVPVYVDKGSALGASIRSIALYADLDPGAVIVYLDNINTVKAAGADALHLRSLIGKNTSDELWWGLREINGTALAIDGTPYNYFGTNQRVGRGYWGTTESVTTYIRDPIVVAQTTGSFAAVQESGSAGNLITYSGGWNRTDMSTQTLETWVDGSGGWGTFWVTNNKDFIHVDKINGVRWGYGLYHESNGTGCTFGTVKMGHCTTTGIYFRGGGITSATELTGYVSGGAAVASFIPSSCTITLIRSISSGLSGSVTSGMDLTFWPKCSVTALEIRNAAWYGLLPVASSELSHSTFGTIDASDCGQIGVSLNATSVQNTKVGTVTCTANGNQGCTVGAVTGRLQIDTMVCTNNVSEGLVGGAGKGGHVIIGSLTTSGNGSGVSLSTYPGIMDVLSSSISEASKVGGSSAATDTNPLGRATFRNYLGVTGDHRSWVGGAVSHGTLVSEASVRHTASGLAWKLSPTHTIIDAVMPLRIPIAKILCDVTAVTVKIWLRRTNTGLTGILSCRGGQLAGVPNDLTDSIGAAIDTWEEQTITFTPSEVGVVEIEVLAYGGATYSLYIDDLTVTQA